MTPWGPLGLEARRRGPARGRRPPGGHRGRPGPRGALGAHINSS